MATVFDEEHSFSPFRNDDYNNDVDVNDNAKLAPLSCQHRCAVKRTIAAIARRARCATRCRRCAKRCSRHCAAVRAAVATGEPLQSSAAFIEASVRPDGAVVTRAFWPASELGLGGERDDTTDSDNSEFPVEYSDDAKLPDDGAPGRSARAMFFPGFGFGGFGGGFGGGLAGGISIGPLTIGGVIGGGAVAGGGIGGPIYDKYGGQLQGPPPPQYGGPQFGGPQFGGPQFGGPQYGGPQFGGPGFF